MISAWILLISNLLGLGLKIGEVTTPEREGKRSDLIVVITTLIFIAIAGYEIGAR